MIRALGNSAVFATLLFASSGANAITETLKCMLYSSSITRSSEETPANGQFIDAIRTSGLCVFEDGQFAAVQNVASLLRQGDFSQGNYSGYSVYTFENGDSLTLDLTGGFGSEGAQGSFNVLGGTGAYTNARGSGGLVVLRSPWKSTLLDNVTINVETPDN